VKTIDESKIGLLESYRKELQAILDRDKQLGSEIEKLSLKQRELQAEINTTKRSLNVLSNDAAAEYDAKVRHRDLVVERLKTAIAERDMMWERTDGRGLKYRLAGAADAVKQALAPGLQVLLKRATAALLPFCESEDRALLIAANGSLGPLPAIDVYGRSMRREWGATGGTPGEVEDAIRTISEIIEGRNPFKLYDGSRIDE
jgi:hypothetical protein